MTWSSSPLNASWMHHSPAPSDGDDEWCPVCERLVPRGGDIACFACGDEAPGRDEPFPGA